MSRWFRWYRGTTENPKFRLAARNGKVTLVTVMAVWQCILEDAASENHRGICEKREDFIAAALDLDDDGTVERALRGLEYVGLLSVGTGAITVVDWQKWQYEQDVSDPTNAERQRRFKDRKRNENASVTGGNGRVTVGKRPDTDTDTERKKEEPSVLERASAPQPRKASPKARGSRIAPDWSPSPDDRQSARSEGMPEAEIDRTAAKFRDFWTGKAGASGVKLDWPATWRNWVRSDCEKRGWTPIAQTATGPPPTNGWRPGLPTDAELRAKYARLKNPEPDDDYAPTH